MVNKLNLAVLLDSEKILLWQFRILDKLISSGYADIKLFIVNEGNVTAKESKKYSLIYRLHEKIDKLIFGRGIDFHKKVEVLKRLKGIEVMKFSNKPLDENLWSAVQRSIYNSNPDLLLNFGNSSIPDELLSKFRFGVLTYNISTQIDQINAPSCYWELVKKMPEIEASIQLAIVDQKGKTEIFRTGILPYPNSININRNNIYELASLFIPRIIEGIYKDGNAYIEEMINKNKLVTEFPGYSVFKYPTSIQAFLNLVLLNFNFLKKKLQFHKIGRWFLLVKIDDKNDFSPAAPGSFNWMKAPKDKFWADPFVITKDGFHYIFIEEYLYKTGKGHISVLKLNDKGELLSNEMLIEKPYHMSYPNVFMQGDSYYMVPETGSNNTIELYKCTEFPNKWEFVKNIMENISAKDTTFFFYNDKWWLFTSIIERNSATISFNELFLYFSDDLFSSNWQSHPQNPIVSDQKLSRSAGKIFINENKIYRPSQDCSGIYGRALNINCITKLSETEYEEVFVSKTEPTWDKKIKGIHTYNFDDKITVMDAFSDRGKVYINN
jgi:hypothetical protein